jgi:hypothetical protein
MLQQTLSLQSRVEQRLRGFRTPSLRILRKALAGIDSATLVKPLTVPYSEPPSGLSTLAAWKKLNIPLASIIEHRKAANTRWQSLNNSWSQDAPPATFGMCKPERPVSIFMSLLPSNADPNNSILALLHLEQPSGVRSDGPFSLTESRLEVGSKKTNPARWKPSSMSYWTHSVYRYNKSTIKALPVTTDSTRKILRAYFNMLPRDSRDVLQRFRARRGTGPSLFRAFVCDRGGRYPSLKQHLIGKISSPKSTFWRPFRRLIELQPKIVFKHYPEEIRVMAFIYDRRIEVVKQKLSKCARHLPGT